MPSIDHLKKIDINDFDYLLPDERIAKFPKAERDTSKLLINDGNQISEDVFKNIATHLPPGSLLVANNTRVVRARLFFRKATGALIELFVLEPVEPTREMQSAFQQKGEAVWQCLAGNARRWKSEDLTLELTHNDTKILIRAQKISRQDEIFLIRFTWNKELSFAEVLEAAGKIPLPPYLHREAVESDSLTYQTVYAQFDGSVAAPTAGLHFTPAVFDRLKAKKIYSSNLTLHVGAGTFKPVGQEGIERHTMHTEQIMVSRQLLRDLLQYQGKVIAVGTTSVRTLESLYWLGVKIAQQPDTDFHIPQLFPYECKAEDILPPEASINNLLVLMEKQNLDVLHGSTQVMIFPGYRFRIISGMITNFHQPRSTLLLLISAWLGEEWKNVYEYAMDNDFRFLSYGDSCLFL